MTSPEDRKPVLVVVAGANGSGNDDPHEPVAARPLAARRDVREAALANSESIAFETVFSAEDKVGYVRRAKLAGFFVRMFYVCTASPEINPPAWSAA